MKEIKAFNSEIIIESPGRINLIGEHIDYNGGFVLPAAINKKIFLHFKKNTKSISKVKSLFYNESFKINLKEKIKKSRSNWKNYIIGVLYYVKKLRKNKLKGFECIIDSNLEVASGISSSSALLCGFIKGLNDLFDLRPAAIIKKLRLKNPIYKRFSAYGHFGREENCSWEELDMVSKLKEKAVKNESI